MAWDRLVWGAEFTGSIGRKFLVGEAWDHVYPVKNRPMRVLLFRTRREAREWRATKLAEWSLYPDGDLVRRWKISVVRVRERAEIVR